MHGRCEKAGGEGGKVALVEANPEKYVEKGQFSQPDRSKQAAQERADFAAQQVRSETGFGAVGASGH